MANAQMLPGKDKSAGPAGPGALDPKIAAILLAAAARGRSRCSSWRRCHRQRTIQFQRELRPGWQGRRAMLRQPMSGGRARTHNSADQHAYRPSGQSADEHSAGSAAAGLDLVAAIMA